MRRFSGGEPTLHKKISGDAREGCRTIGRVISLAGNFSVRQTILGPAGNILSIGKVGRDRRRTGGGSPVFPRCSRGSKDCRHCKRSSTTRTTCRLPSMTTSRRPAPCAILPRCSGRGLLSMRGPGRRPRSRPRWPRCGTPGTRGRPSGWCWARQVKRRASGTAVQQRNPFPPSVRLNRGRWPRSRRRHPAGRLRRPRGVGPLKRAFRRLVSRGLAERAVGRWRLEGALRQRKRPLRVANNRLTLDFRRFAGPDSRRSRDLGGRRGLVVGDLQGVDVALDAAVGSAEWVFRPSRGSSKP